MTTMIVLAMHGAPPVDFPRKELAEFFKLHVQMEHAPDDIRKKIGPGYAVLEGKIRTWPRTAENDPFFAGAMEMARELSSLSGCEVVVGFNEFCSPTLSEAIASACESDPEKVVVLTPMMTRGGEHAEIDIPREIENARLSHPGIPIVYAWPFEVSDVARFLSSHMKGFV